MKKCSEVELMETIGGDAYCSIGDMLSGNTEDCMGNAVAAAISIVKGSITYGGAAAIEILIGGTASAPGVQKTAGGGGGTPCYLTAQ